MKRSPVALRVLLVFGSSSVVAGCDFLAKKATEQVIESATGNAVEIDGERVRIRTEDGKTAEIDGRKETVTVRTEAGETVYTQRGGKVTVDGPEGRVQIAGQDAELPKDFPLPVPSESSVIQTTQMDSEQGGVMRSASLRSKSSPKSIGDFYRDHLESEGFKVKRTETQAGPMSMVLIAAEKGKVQVGAQIVAGTDGEPGSMVNLSWVEKR